MSTEAIAIAAPMPPRAKPEKDWLSRKEAANYLRAINYPITFKTLAKYAANNNALKGPPFTRIGWSMVQYRRADLDVWAESRKTRIK